MTRSELLEVAAGSSNRSSEASRRRDERKRARFLDELARPVELCGTSFCPFTALAQPVSCSDCNGYLVLLHNATCISILWNELLKEEFYAVPKEQADAETEVDEEEDGKRRPRRVVHVDTLDAQRAREFRDLYDALVLENDECLHESKRIELLFNLRRIAMQHTCPASSTLERLLDQELFFISTRAQPTRLKNLRSRIRLSFLRLARGLLLSRRDTRRQTVS
ncbi:hypothetical protein QAD02_014458 [Eretmocerus hayati]|uniref:Uncharacterized protein n=1 Tax=Eretmocerus hayati TaxID=131215 RepID=A0ACC2P712_9HYME|nr:hypothetical protein QAD02_014458 [Eretmocerus hayati]